MKDPKRTPPKLPGREKGRITVACVLTPSMYEKLEARRARSLSTRSAIISEALRQFLRNEG